MRQPRKPRPKQVQPATEPQLRYLLILGFDPPPGMTKAHASMQIVSLLRARKPVKVTESTPWHPDKHGDDSAQAAILRKLA